MSKLDIGVGEEFPLDEGRLDGRPAWKHRHQHGHRRDRHGFHHHSRRGLLNLPMLAGVAAIAALIGAGRISPLESHVILAVAVTLVVIARFMHHRRWHRRPQ